MAVTRVEVYPKLGETYPDAAGVPITSVGAIVDESKYIEDALRDGFLLTWDPLDIYHPENRTTNVADAPATAAYVTLAADATLTNERVLQAGPGVTITDGGPNAPVTISATVTSAVTSVFGRVGAVLAALGDYSSALVSNASTVAGATVSAALDTLAGAISSLSTGLAGKAPVDAEYLVSTASAGLTAERVLMQGANITLTPGPGTLTIASTAGGGGAPTDAEYLVSVANGTLSAERVLTQGANITLTPSAGALTVASPNSVQGPASVTQNANIARYSGTTGKLIQDSGVVLDNLNSLKNVNDLSCNSVSVVAGGLVDGVDISVFAAAPFVTVGNTTAMANERALTQGPGITLTDGGAGAGLTAAATGDYLSVTTWTTASLQLALAHRGGAIVAAESVDQVLTIPADATLNLPVGYRVRLLVDTGTTTTVTITPAGAVAYSGFRIDRNNDGVGNGVGWNQLTGGGVAELVKLGPNYWAAIGNFLDVP